jgi:hypothetical protein
MQAGLASLKNNCKSKENFKQTRIAQAPPGQKSAAGKAIEQHAEPSESKMDFNSIISELGQFNSKTFTMPKTAQFEQKWQIFQNTLQQLTLDWIDIMRECATKKDDEHKTKTENQKSPKDTKTTNSKMEKKTKWKTNKRMENKPTEVTQKPTQTKEMPTSFKEGLKKLSRTYADAASGARVDKDPVTVNPKCTLDNPREQNGPALRETDETEDEDDKGWTVVTKKARIDPSPPPRTKPMTVNSECTLDTTREQDEPAMESAKETSNIGDEQEREQREREAKKPNGKYSGGSLSCRTPCEYEAEKKAQARREYFQALPDHRSLLFRAQIAREHPHRLMRQISEAPMGRDTHNHICQELKEEILATMEEEPAEWRRIIPIQICLQNILDGKPVFPSKALAQPTKGYREADAHVTEILRCIAANPSLMATPWGKSLRTPKANETRRELQVRIGILRRMPLPPREPSHWEETPPPPTEEELERAKARKLFPTFTEAQEDAAAMEEEYLSDNNKDPEDIYGPRHPGEIEPGDYMEDYMCSYEDYYAGDPPEPAEEYEPDTVVMIPIGNDYIDNHQDPTLAQIQYILTQLISRKERFGMIKGIVNGTQARKITNTASANKKILKKKTRQQKARHRKKREQGFNIWIKGTAQKEVKICTTTTAQSLVEELFPEEPRPNVTLRHEGRTWQPKATAANKGIKEGDTIHVLSRGLGGMMQQVLGDGEDDMDEGNESQEQRYQQLQARSPNRVIRPSEFVTAATKRQRVNQGTMDAFLTPKQDTTGRTSTLDEMRLEDTGRSLEIHPPEHEATQLDEEEEQATPEDPAKEVKNNYLKDSFTRTFLFKQLPMPSLTVDQRREITDLKIDQIGQILNLTIPASTIQVGPLRMSQIPDVVKAIAQMGYPIHVPTVMHKIDSNVLQRYVHNFDRKKPDRCMLTIEMEREAEFSTIPNDNPLVLQIWRQFMMNVGAGAEKSFIKIQPCHPVHIQTHPLCTLYDIHTGNMQLDMIQHCYLIMHQCLSEKNCKGKLYIEFRMGSVPNPSYNPKDRRSKSRITTTFGIVYISQPSAGEGIQLVEWITSLQKRIKCRMQRKGTNSRHVILQGPYTIGITFDRYQDIPPTFHTTTGSLSSDPIICLLNVPPCFQEPLGEALDKLSEMLATNMILSIHVRDDWIKEEGVHEPRLSVAFTMTGPPMTEAVRSMVQSAIRETLNNPRAVVLLPNTSSQPIPWNRVEEMPAQTPNSHTGKATPPNSRTAMAAPQRRAWQAVSREPVGPIVTNTYDISGIQGLPETISRLNIRMNEIEAAAKENQERQKQQITELGTNVRASNERQEEQFGQVFTMLAAMNQTMMSLAQPRDPQP